MHSQQRASCWLLQLHTHAQQLHSHAHARARVRTNTFLDVLDLVLHLQGSAARQHKHNARTRQREAVRCALPQRHAKHAELLQQHVLWECRHTRILITRENGGVAMVERHTHKTNLRRRRIRAYGIAHANRGHSARALQCAIIVRKHRAKNLRRRIR